MSDTLRSQLRAVQATLGVIVLGTAVTWLSPLPGPFVFAGSDVLLSLVVPGALGVVCLLDVAVDGTRPESVIVASLGGIVAFLAAWSAVPVLAAGGGGAFFGGVLTLFAAVPLVVAVGVRIGLDRFGRRSNRGPGPRST